MLLGQPLSEPHNLGKGWVGFDFQKAFGRPVQIVNDAAMQGLGSFKKGEMLFLFVGGFRLWQGWTLKQILKQQKSQRDQVNKGAYIVL